MHAAPIHPIQLMLAIALTVLPASTPLAQEGRTAVGTGTLRAVHADGLAVVDFPLKHTSVTARVAGAVADVRVTQTFTNPNERAIEAVYVFPLPHDAAVNELEIRIGDRTIRGEIQRREEAKRKYEAARRAGRTAALLEQERPNIFTQSVANIAPGEDVHVTLHYVEDLPMRDGAHELVFPMVVGPRYIPGGAGGPVVPAGVRDAASGPDGTSSAVPDADRITPPVLPPTMRSTHDIDLTVELDAGVALAELESPTHAIERTRHSDSRVDVRLSALDSVPNRDFILRWRVKAKGPEVARFAYHDGEEGYVSLVLHPPAEPRSSQIRPREMVFVLDCSGSMRGAPIETAKDAVRHAIRNLRPGDSFRIIRFSMSASELSSVPLSATPENVAAGLAYVDALRGGGGTEMIRGIRAALEPEPHPERLRIVWFLTDGYIGNEDQILAAVRDLVGSSRLFSLGVGNSVNRFLLDEIAREGRGEVQYVRLGGDTHEQVETFYERIRTPTLTDVELEWKGVQVVDAYPARPRDLFTGQPLRVKARYARGGRGELIVRGRLGDKAWKRKVKLDLPDEPAGIAAVGTLWARARVEDLSRGMRHGLRPELVEEITALGLRHHLVTRYTSFVAVDDRVVGEGNPRRLDVPLGMPDGVSYEGVFGPNSSLPMQVPGSAAKIRAVNTTEEAVANSAGAVQLGDNLFVRGGRSAEVKTVVDGMPVADAFGRAPLDSTAMFSLEVFEIRADRLKALRKEESSSIHVIDVTCQDLRLPRLEVTLASEEEILVRDGSFLLTVTFRNRSSEPIRIPAPGALTPDNVDLLAIGAGGAEQRIGKGRFRGKTMELAPGATVTRRLILPVSALGRLMSEEAVELVLRGERWNTTDSKRLRLWLRDGDVR